MLNFSNKTFDNNFVNNNINYTDYNDSNSRNDAYYSYYDYDNPWPKQDMFYLGIACIMPVLLGLPAYILVLYLFTTQVEFTTQFSYRLMVYLGIADMLQMSYYVVFGITLMMNTTFGYTFTIFFDAYYYSIWTLVNLMILLLAINRFDVLVKVPIEMDRVKFFNILAITFVLIALSQFILGLIPKYRMYSLRPLGITFGKAMMNAYWYYSKLNYIALGCAVLLYFLSIVSMVIKRCIITNSRNVTIREIRMLLQTIIPCLVKSAIAISLDYAYPTTRFETAVLEFFIFLEASYPPFLYMIINKALQIRIRGLVEMIKQRKRSNSIFSAASVLKHA